MRPATHQRSARLSQSRARVLIAIVCVALGAFITWAWASELEEIARAHGQVIAVARTQVVQAADIGVLEAIAVREGEAVERGQLLARLDASRARAAYEDSRSKVAALETKLVRLRAEVFGRALDFPAELSESYGAYVQNQSELYQRRRQALEDGLAALKKMLGLARAELAITRSLRLDGDVGQAEVLRLERQEAEIEGQIVNLRNKYFQDAQLEMTDSEVELATQQQVLTERTTLLDHTEIKAPAAGLVKKIGVTTPGAAVRAGEELMELLPTGSDLVVEAKFSPTDVAYLRSGLPAAVKLDAYDYSIYGTVAGKVTYVSPDALTESDPRLGEQVYYRVQVRLDPRSVARPRGKSGGKVITVHPGMTAQVEVRTGTRSVLAYLTKPVTKTLSESLHER